MPIPLVWIAGAAVLALLGGAAAKQFLARASGKTVLLVGPRDSGKTVLFELLTSGERQLKIPKDTADTFDFDEATVPMGDLGLGVVVDSPSTFRALNDLKHRIEGADLVVFLADVGLMREPRYADAAEQLAGTYRTLDNGETRWMFLLTHADLLDPRPTATEAMGDVLGCERLSKLLDDEPLVCNLLEESSADVVVQRVLERLQQ